MTGFYFLLCLLNVAQFEDRLTYCLFLTLDCLFLTLTAWINKLLKNCTYCTILYLSQSMWRDK